jgi:adenosylcobinamide kinase / adenosylcobinamide-phosphate guanylyltransferase
MPLTLLLGGARSGKSQLAVDMARGTAARVAVIATGEPRDDEMAERITRHRAQRPAGWQTIEEPVDLCRAMASVDAGACVLVDCLTLWTSNLLERECNDAEIEEQAAAAAGFAAVRGGATIAVSNEVGWGIVPVHPTARRYRDVLGRVNTIWAAASTQALLVVAGRVLPLTLANAGLERSHDV